jgi:hypothetical protein
MTDFERINAPRAAKIVDMLRVIDASARSQKASPEEVRTLLQPVYEKLKVPLTSVPVRMPEAAPADVVVVPRLGVTATHDGLLVSALGNLLKTYDPEAVRDALEWRIQLQKSRK